MLLAISDPVQTKPPLYQDMSMQMVLSIHQPPSELIPGVPSRKYAHSSSNPIKFWKAIMAYQEIFLDLFGANFVDLIDIAGNSDWTQNGSPGTQKLHLFIVVGVLNHVEWSLWNTAMHCNYCTVLCRCVLQDRLLNCLLCTNCAWVTGSNTTALVALINAPRRVHGPLSCLHLLSGMGPMTMRIKNAGEMKGSLVAHFCECGRWEKLDNGHILWISNASVIPLCSPISDFLQYDCKITNLWHSHHFHPRFECLYILQSVYPEPLWVKPELLEEIPPLPVCNCEYSLMVNQESSCSKAKAVVLGVNWICTSESTQI